MNLQVNESSPIKNADSLITRFPAVVNIQRLADSAVDGGSGVNKA